MAGAGSCPGNARRPDHSAADGAVKLANLANLANLAKVLKVLNIVEARKGSIFA